MKKGITLIEVLGTLTFTAVLLLMLTRLSLYLFDNQDRMEETNVLLVDAIVIQENITVDIEELVPTEFIVCADYDICYEFYVDVADPHLIIGFDETSTDIYDFYIHYDNQTPFQILLDNELRDVTFQPSTCTSCTEKDVMTLLFTMRNTGDHQMPDIITDFSFVVK